MSTSELELVSSQDDIIVVGSTWAAIWHMAWPGLLNMVTIAIASFADVFVAGKLGPEVQAAIGIGGQIWFFMTLMAVALSAGSTALVSRFWGARDYKGAAEAARASLVFAILFGVVSMVVGLLAARPLYHVLGASAQVEEQGWRYLQWDLLTQVPFTTIWVAHSIFRAKGNARVPLVIWFVMMCLIITLDQVLCLNPFHFGIAGIGIAWLVAALVGLALNFFLLGKSDISECVDFRPIFKHGLSFDWLKRLFHIGMPACVQDFSWVGSNFVLFAIFAKTPDPTSCQASWAVGLRLEEMVAGLPVFAIALAIGTIVGQNLGARQPERAELAGWQAAFVGAAFNLTVGMLMFTLAVPIAQFMSHDCVVADYTRQYLQIVGISEPMVAAWLILFGAMQGAGYTKWPMIATTICLVVIRLPLSWYLTVHEKMVPCGCWLGIAAASIGLGSAAIWRYRTGVWKNQKV